MCENAVYQCFVATDQGHREYMEDFVCVHRKPPSNKCKRSENFREQRRDDRLIDYVAVFDGHGGVDAANFARKHLFDEIMNRNEFWSSNTDICTQAIKDGFISTSKAMWNVVGKFSYTEY